MAGNANYNTDELSATFEIFMSDKPSDVIFGDLVLWEVLGKHNKVTKRGGQKILEPLMKAKSTAVGSYSGYDTLDIAPQEGLTQAEFNWKWYYGTVAFSNPELLQNRGDAQKIDLMEARFQQAKMSLADAMGADMFLDGTGNGSKDILGLALLVDSAGTLGNIARSTDTYWASQETAAGGVLGIAGSTGMRRMYNDCSLGRGRQTPDVIVTTQIGYEAYEALMDPYMRFTNNGEQNVGYRNQNLRFRNASMFWDDYCQSGVMYFLNRDFLRLVVMDQRGEGGVSTRDDGKGDRGDFRVGPFEQPINQDSKVAKFFWGGNFVISNCARQGKLTGLTNT